MEMTSFPLDFSRFPEVSVPYLFSVFRLRVTWSFCSHGGGALQKSLLHALSFSQAVVIHAVEKVCSLLPGKSKQRCKDLIETYGQAIIDLLVQEVDPKTVCTVLGLCRDASRTFIRESPRPLKTPHILRLGRFWALHYGTG